VGLVSLEESYLMASRKRLRPVAAPVDPFVTPANPGPEQSNQTWDGLLQLSNSLMSADKAYREADEKKKREARVAKAEERRQRAQAEADAPVGAEVLAKLVKQQPDLVTRLNQGEATDEDRQTLISAFAEAEIGEPNNPALIGEIKKYQVIMLPSKGDYENTMLDPEFLDSIQVLPEDQKQQAMQERKAEWVASQNVPESLRPTLLAKLRGYDERVNSVLASRRLKQHEAQTNRIYTDAAGLATEAIVSLDDNQKAVAVQQIVSFHKSLSAADQTKAEKQLMGVMSERLKYEITSEDMKEDDVDDLISMLEENKLLPAEDIAKLQNMAESALRIRTQRAQDPVRSAQVDRDIAGILATAIAQQERQNGNEPLTNEQLENVVNGRYEEIEGIYRGAGLKIERTQTAINDAKRLYRGDRESRRSDDRDLVVSLDNMVDQLNPDAIENINQAYVDKKITRETRNRLLDEVEQSTDPEQVSTRVQRFLQRQTIPGGIQTPQLQRDLEQVFASTPGSLKEKGNALRGRFQGAIRDLLDTQPDSLRTDKPFYWLAEGRAGRSGAIRSVLNDTVSSYVEQYGEEKSEELFGDVLGYIFDGLSNSEKDRFRSLPENQQATQLTRYALQLTHTKPRQALEGYLKEKIAAKQTAAIRQKITGQQEALTEGRAISGIGQLNIREAGREALAAVAPTSSIIDTLLFNHDHYIDAAHQMIERFSEVETGGDLSSRLPRGFGYTQLLYQDATYVRALARFAGVTDGVQIPEFKEFPDADSAKKYLRLHTLNYGVPLKSLSTGRHLGLDLAEMGLTWDSSPYFGSLQDLQRHISKNEEGQWELSKQAADAFRFFKLNTEQETIQRFYNVQAKMTADRPDEQEFLRRMQTPNLSALRVEGGFIKFRGVNILESEFRKEVMGDK
jgi:hypothetical protein